MVGSEDNLVGLEWLCLTSLSQPSGAGGEGRGHRDDQDNSTENLHLRVQQERGLGRATSDAGTAGVLSDAELDDVDDDGVDTFGVVEVFIPTLRGRGRGTRTQR